MESEKEKKEREKLDSDTIEALKKAGLDLSKPHYIEHHFVCINKNNVSKICDSLKKEGYHISEVYEELGENSKKYFFFDVCKYCLIESNTIFRESRKMNELSLFFNEFYDGWGTNVVKK